MPSSKYALSLFAGMGGDCLGMEKAGFTVIAFNEFNKHAIITHKENFPNSIQIQNVDKKKDADKNNIQMIPDEEFEKYKNVVDLVFAGHPCQGFSHGGKKLPEDPRNTLFREFARVARLIKPKYIIGENVDGLLSRKTVENEKFIDIIVTEFDAIGYRVNFQVCNAAEYGIPQLRKRLFYVGIRKDLEYEYTFPLPRVILKAKKGVLSNLKDVVKFDMTGAIRIVPDDFDMTTIPEECILTDMENEEQEIPEKVHPFLRVNAKTRNKEYLGKTHRTLLSFAKRESSNHGEIIDIRNPSKTIICTYDHQPRLYVPLRNKNGYFLRCLLPDELKQIQGFPADFKLVGSIKEQIKQIGNAVPPRLVQQIVEKL